MVVRPSSSKPRLALSRLCPLTKRSMAVVWLMVVRASRMLAQFLIVILLARFHGPESAGQLALTLAVCAPIFILSDLGLRTITLTMKPRVAFARLLKVRLIATTCALAGCIILTQVPGLSGSLILIVAIAKTADAFVELALAPTQLDHALHKVGLLTAGTYGIAALTVALLVTRTSPETALWIGLALPTVIMGLVALVFGKSSARRVDPHPQESVSITRILRAGGAVGIASGILSFSAGIPQYAISGTISTAESGRYAVIMYLVLGAELALNAAVQAWLPTGMSIHSASGVVGLRRYVNSAMVRSTAISLPISLALVVSAAFVIPAVVGPGYALQPAEAIALTALLLCEPALFIGAAGLQVLNLYSSALFTSLIAILTVVIVAVIAVPAWGVAGGLFATTSGVIARITITQYIYKRESVHLRDAKV